MNEATRVAASAAWTPGWKWLAVLIGLALLALLYAVRTVTSGKLDLRKLVEGADGRASTSKFQWLLWIVVFVFAYAVLWALRAKQGNYAAISQVPTNLLTVLGLSTGTAAAAKGITSGYIKTGHVAKHPVADGASRGGILQDDSGVPELAKIQVMGFTLIAIGIFLATLIHQIVSNPVITSLPNLDSSLLVLIGISQGGYLAMKLATFGAPTLYSAVPPAVAAGTAVTVTGASFGPSPSDVHSPALTAPEPGLEPEPEPGPGPGPEPVSARAGGTRAQLKARRPLVRRAVAASVAFASAAASGVATAVAAAAPLEGLLVASGVFAVAILAFEGAVTVGKRRSRHDAPAASGPDPSAVVVGNAGDGEVASPSQRPAFAPGGPAPAIEADEATPAHALAYPRLDAPGEVPPGVVFMSPSACAPTPTGQW